MDTELKDNPRWATSSHGGTTQPSPLEVSALGQELEDCNRSRGRLFAWQCAADSVVLFVATHFVTTLALVVLVVATTLVVLRW